jgi:hypothetical protein
MKATIEIQIDNAAFEECPASELVRILEETIKRIKAGYDYVALMDINGNKVGEFKIEK